MHGDCDGCSGRNAFQSLGREGTRLSIQLYNSMSGTKEPLITIEPGKVRFYACGPTVYDLFHLGNARMFIVFDTIRRYLEYRGYEVRYVQNFTDVDDKIIARAIASGKAVRAVANENIDAYFQDADALGIRRAWVHPRVTECIPDIIAFVQELIDKGHAYARAGDVYFDTSTFPQYGKLSHQSVDDLRSGFRIEVQEVKDDPTDFALWKSAKPGEEYWDSPWGPGRPGWHIECSVMNRKYLGEQIDIHAGGRDLIFPHHENEIAQSEAYSGRVFARYWLHNGTLNINGEKMSKSLGNFVTARQLLGKRSGIGLRYYLLSAHYRHPLNYTEEGMDQAEQAMERFQTSLRNLQHRLRSGDALPAFARPLQESSGDDAVRTSVDEVRQQFISAMDDDFNTADGITAIHEAARRANSYLVEATVTPVGLGLWHSVIEELMGALGLIVSGDKPSDDAGIDGLVQARESARKRRDFAEADRIRDQLLEQGIVIEDTPQGPRWYRK